MATGRRGASTAVKDLHDGQPVWSQSTYGTITVSALTKDERCDVLVVGAGITGALTALHLAEAGYDVIVVDRRVPGTGSTIASTAMIQFEIDEPLTELAKTLGPAKAARVYRRSFQAVKDLKTLIKKHELRADWVDRDALYLAGNVMGRRALEKEARAREKIGLPSTYLDAETLKEMYGFDRTGAIISAGAAELDPMRTCIACLKAARDMGAKIYSPVSVTASEQDGDDIRVATTDGPDIICRHLVMATGYEVSPAIPKGSFDIVSSWAIATQPIKPQRFWRDRCLVWEASDPYLYMRATADNRIVIGGEDADVSAPSRRAAAIPAKSKKLLEKAKELTGLDELECDYSWAGAFAENPKGLPVFKRLHDVKGGYAILGCGGNGITFSVIGAQIIRDWIGGTSDPDASLFRG
jgi:glycine/D-amino acid oxidase-like deaminating enzyme